jgi:hypothetical protein
MSELHGAGRSRSTASRRTLGREHRIAPSHLVEQPREPTGFGRAIARHGAAAFQPRTPQDQGGQRSFRGGPGGHI